MRFRDKDPAYSRFNRYSTPHTMAKGPDVSHSTIVSLYNTPESQNTSCSFKIYPIAMTIPIGYIFYKFWKNR